MIATAEIVLSGYLTAIEVAEEMGVSSAYVRRLAHMGALPTPLRVRGSDTAYHRASDVADYIKEHPRLGSKRRATAAQ